MAAIVGIFVAKTRRIKLFVLAGWATSTLGFGLLVLLKPSTTIVQWIFINIPSGVGIGILFGCIGLATQAAAESSDRSPEEVAKIKSMAAGLNPFFRTIGQTLGIVVGQAAFANQMRKELGDQAAQDAASLTQLIATLPASSAEKTALVNAFAASLRVVWWILLALSAAMLVLSSFTKDVGFGNEAAVQPQDRNQDVEKVAHERVLNKQ